jgi:hypothetical protein
VDEGTREKGDQAAHKDEEEKSLCKRKKEVV